MNKETQSVLAGLLGAVLIGITASGRFTNYVKPGFGPLLLISGIVLILVAVCSLVLIVRADRRRESGVTVDHAEHDHHAPGEVDAHGHEHTSSRAPWLLLIPVLVLLLVAPSALGADAVARSGGSQAIAGLDVTGPVAGSGGGGASADKSGIGAVTGDGGYAPNDGLGKSNNSKSTSAASGTGGRGMDFPALPAGQNPQLPLKQLVLRALYDNTGSVAKTPVTVTGFVADAGAGQSGGYTIARVVISCCAADANPMRVHVAGTAPFPPNTWVNAVVLAEPGTGTMANDYVPTVSVQSITQTSQPSDPYEH